MRIIIMTLAILVMPLITQAQEIESTPIDAMPGGLYKLDKNHASLTWKVMHMGMSNYTARFTDFDAELLFNPIELEKTQMRATINPASVETDHPDKEKDFNKELAFDAGWFNSEQYPEIKFRSTNIEITGDNTGKVTGDLTFLGVKKPVTLDVIFNKAVGNHPFDNKPALGFTATGSLKRSEFGMKKYIPMVGDEVRILIEVEFMYAK